RPRCSRWGPGGARGTLVRGRGESCSRDRARVARRDRPGRCASEPGRRAGRRDRLPERPVGARSARFSAEARRRQTQRVRQRATRDGDDLVSRRFALFAVFALVAPTGCFLHHAKSAPAAAAVAPRERSVDSLWTLGTKAYDRGDWNLAQRTFDL